MKYAKNASRSKLFRSHCLLSAIVLPSLLLSSFAVGQTINEEKTIAVEATVSEEKTVNVASVDATDLPQADEAAIVSQSATPVLHAAAEARSEAIRTFARASADKLDAADRSGIAALYEDRGYKSLWMKEGALRPEAKALIAEIRQADRIGLNPADYSLPMSDDADGTVLSETAAFEIDLQMSLAAVRYVRHLASGRLVPRSVSASLDINPERPDAKAVLTELNDAGDPVAKANEYQPKHQAYLALLKELQAIEQNKAEKPIVVDAGRLLRPGMSDPRVLQLRARLKVELPAATPASEDVAATPASEDVAATPASEDVAATPASEDVAATPASEDVAATPVDENLYDETLVTAVKDFQKKSRLTQDGIIGPATLRVLNGETGIERKAQLIVNLERWRWMPKELGAFHIMANIPEYRVYVKSDGKVTHTTRVVVGKPEFKTVAFSDEMEHFVVNPSWGVPQSIIKNEMLPSARSSPGYFTRKGYQVFAQIRGRTRQVDPSRVNWRRVTASQISVRQPPGNSNALGRIKFMFPNKHAIYMHDTPSKSLFNKDARAYSHGCVRIQNPMEFADAILEQQKDWNSTRIKKLVGGKEVTVKLDKKIPVHLVYFTAIQNDEGAVGYLPDVYGHDRNMVKLLGL
uniref:L,D-transpeptidase family protein n=1 Tax=Pararhizobium sp. IMCC3301 TaxID=3067904 RepID=UPI002741E9B6|nr:L,D-transpeptidase family protein [Pararhizobium sp. IMCC3301]